MVRASLVSLVIGLILCGCGGKESDESLAKRAGNKLGQSMTDFASGVGGGVDQKLMVDVTLSDELTEKGFTKTVAKSLGVDLNKGITVYLIAGQPYEGGLMAKVLNAEDQEVGRSLVRVKFEADDAQYVEFAFRREVDMQLAKRFTIEAREMPPEKEGETESPKPPAGIEL
jgi:hypothetical protein